MKKSLLLWTLLLTGTALVPAVASAEQIATNRFTLSARFGFNISASFKGFSFGAPASTPRTPRHTPSQPGRPSGDAYNYDDGYVLTDLSGNYGGQTWYWGYDNSAPASQGGQVSGNSILFSRSTPGTLPASGSVESEPYSGAEITYNRELGRHGQLHYGLEIAANYMNFTAQDNRSVLARVIDAYPFTPGTTPPTATPSRPYQGSYQGPDFVLGDTPVSSTRTTLGQQKFDSDIWGFRLGPYLELPLGTNVNLSVSGGLALGLLDSTASWSETVSVMGGSTSTIHRGNGFDAVWGGYVSADVSWRLSKRWSAAGGVQFQDLGTYEHAFAGQKVALDLSRSMFVTVGLTYCF